MSPTPGRSTLMTSAPNQASSCVQVGPDWTWVKSRMRTPSSALPSLPQGLAETLAGLATSASDGFRAGLVLALALTFALAFFTFLLAIVVPLFLPKLALWVQVADAA